MTTSTANGPRRRTTLRSWQLAIGLVVAVVVLLGPSADILSAVELRLKRPGDREFVRDWANLIEPADEQEIRELCDKLLTDKATPIVVVTIDAMESYGGSGMRIETFAMVLFNQWGIGHERFRDQLWNTGILLLVSSGDRKARIELGAGWGREKDAICDRIMQNLIIPRFKRGNFSKGILAGVKGLERMVRERSLPAVPRSWQNYALILGFVGLMIFTVVSLIRRGSSGWAFLIWAAVFGVLGYLLYHILTSDRMGGGDSSFSGGSFGGGFSGGGGATGSW